jgi:hypothetical protein
VCVRERERERERETDIFKQKMSNSSFKEKTIVTKSICSLGNLGLPL